MGAFSGSVLFLFTKSNIVVEGAAQFSPKGLLRSDRSFRCIVCLSYSSRV